MRDISIGLFMHWFKHDNLGVAALSISNLIILDQVMDSLGINVQYTSFKTNNIKKSNDYISNNKLVFKNFPRFREVILSPFNSIKKIDFNCDFAFDLCGGDSFTDIYGWRHSIPQLFIKSCLIRKNIPLIFSPQTIGPFKSRILELYAKQILKKVDMVFARDKMSYDYAKEKLNITKLKEVTDVAMILPWKNKKLQQKENMATKPLKVGLNVSGLMYNGGYNKKNQFKLKANYKTLIDELLNFLKADKNIEIHLIPHVISENDQVEDDYRVCLSLSKNDNNIILPEKFNTPMEAKTYISNMDFLIGSRMHSTIAAFSTNVPILPISYSRKFEGLYQTYGYKNIANARVLNVRQIIKMVKECIDRKAELKETIECGNKKALQLLEIYKKNLMIYFAKKLNLSI
jgi:polysaccharide pyruvyl transferase WcaK-like protein